MAISKRHREVLLTESDVNLVVTIDTEEKCLLLYPLGEWEDIEQRIEALPSFNPITRRIQRLLIGHANEVDMDNQGRVLIPPLLREYAALQKRVIVVGQGRKFELWSEQHWQARREQWLDQGIGEADELPAELGSLSM